MESNCFVFVVELHKKSSLNQTSFPTNTHIRPLGILLCHNLLKCRHNRKPEVGQPQGVQWDVTPSSKRLYLFKAVVETPCLDLHNIFITFSHVWFVLQSISFPLSECGRHFYSKVLLNVSIFSRYFDVVSSQRCHFTARYESRT